MFIGETATNIETALCLSELLEVLQMFPQDVFSISLRIKKGTCMCTCTV